MDEARTRSSGGARPDFLTPAFAGRTARFESVSPLVTHLYSDGADARADERCRHLAAQHSEFNTVFRAKHQLRHRLWGNDNIADVANVLSGCLRAAAGHAFQFRVRLFIRKRRAALLVTGVFRWAGVRRRTAVVTLGALWIQHDGECRREIRKDGRRHDLTRLQADAHDFALQFVPDDMKPSVVQHLYWEKRRRHFAEWQAWSQEVTRLSADLQKTQRLVAEQGAHCHGQLLKKRERLQTDLQALLPHRPVFAFGPALVPVTALTRHAGLMALIPLPAPPEKRLSLPRSHFLPPLPSPRQPHAERRRSPREPSPRATRPSLPCGLPSPQHGSEPWEPGRVAARTRARAPHILEPLRHRQRVTGTDT